MWKPISEMPEFKYVLVRIRPRGKDEDPHYYVRDQIFLGSRAGSIVSGPGQPMWNVEVLDAFMEVPE